MKTAERLYLFIFSLFVFFAGAPFCNAQNRPGGAVVADFSIPDTVCVNTPLPITNLSQVASTWLWKFCTGDALTDIHCIDLGNPSATLDEPLGITLVQDGTVFYAFNTNSITGTITRTTWSNGLMHPPTATNLGNFGMLKPGIFGIQVKKEGFQWYAFVTNDTSLVRLDLGNSLSADFQNAIVVAHSPAMNKSRGLVIEQEGAGWVGFCTNFPAKTITRFSWPTSLTINPVLTNLGNVGGLTEPMQPALIRDNTGWYMFVANTISLTQLFFGNSLLNTPTGINLGNLGWMTDDRGMSLFVQCNNPYGLITNHNLVTNLLLQLHFTGGLAGTKSITPLGSVANLYEPLALSESVTVGDTIFTIALNATPSMTTLYFPPCSNSPIPPSTLFVPPPAVLTTPGTYTLTLTADPGLPTEQTKCKVFVVDMPVPVHLGNDTSICEGATLALDPGNWYNQYAWSTGETTQTITVSQAGSYSVRVTDRRNCQTADTIHVAVVQQINTTVDTSICFGHKYLAGGQQQSTSGTYIDSLVMPGGCYKVITTHLLVKPEIRVSIGADTCLSVGDTIGLKVRVAGSSGTTWQDGSHDSLFRVIRPGRYWVTVLVNNCRGADTIRVTACSGINPLFFPSAFSPNGDGLNDLFRPKGGEVADFHMIIYDRWGQLVFDSHDPGTGWDGTYRGKTCQAGVYTYIATYGNVWSPEDITKITGSFTLVR